MGGTFLGKSRCQVQPLSAFRTFNTAVLVSDENVIAFCLKRKYVLSEVFRNFNQMAPLRNSVSVSVTSLILVFHIVPSRYNTSSCSPILAVSKSHASSLYT